MIKHMINTGKAGKIALLAISIAAMVVALPATALQAEAASNVKRNDTFTSVGQMQTALGSLDESTWSPLYLTQVENDFWSFCDPSEYGSRAISLNTAKNAYRNLEELLDNGYTMDYATLSNYCAEYLGKKNGNPDSFYNIMSDCLKNPYISGKPDAEVTATTYNGRDYSKVFDAQYYYNNNPDLQKSIGNNPAELLRQFVEVGINEGRQGNASFDVKGYAAQYDAQVLSKQLSSSMYTSLGGTPTAPLGKYSYSYANYYGLYLGHYDTTESAGTEDIVQTGTAPGITVRTSRGTYTEASTNSVYTNEPVSSTLANQRPIAVMMPTDTQAQPSYGIGKADVLYEIMEEGGISRQMAIIQDWQGLSRIGNLRSCRLYYIYAAKEWDPILVHFGGVAYMKGVINASDVDNLSGTYEYGTGGSAPGAGFFFRSSDRSAPHNAYISASGITKAAAQYGYSLQLRDGVYNSKHFSFANGENNLSQYSNAMSANTIDLRNVFTYTQSKLTYNAADGLYYKYLHGARQVDATTGKQLSFANVIVQNTGWQQLDKKGYLAFDMLGTKQDGYYFTKGKAIHITWVKTYDYEPTRYFDDNGNEIQMNTGKTYIAVAQQGKNVIF